MFRRPQPVRPDPLRIDRLRKRGQLLSELEGAEIEPAPRTTREIAVYGVVILAVLVVAAAIVIRII